MGEHQPQTPPVDEGATLPGPGPAPAGPRVAAKRARRKRTLILAGAAGLALIVGGTATAAVITSGAGPDSAGNAIVVPEADPDPLVPQEEGSAGPDAEAAQGAETAVAGATQTTSVDASDVLEEPEPEPEPESSSGGGTSGGGGGEPTGEGGTCEASYYGADFAGRTTANGETFDPNAMTAAHKTLPFDTMVQVTNPDNGKSVTVRINDRGPFIAGRCLDLSTVAFDQIIGTGAGVGQVRWQVVS
ncbi:septal ring lytic transglycosylase RlpA family protein [Nocardiopsis lambiniae]|uniref:Probable endolytic peptidoglycan transglycosylase RlpA n=1 Tax=Nocardiopsis lambiniae TaxID=3075539 RepID=A0ABU2MHA2_9ACTN|nr:septal ring lytic transglycosylase RlpA family protein [Nocardiopsis sp. DSM 44743]MDT0331944.1 septal ring lytic transglycosylase RlpA family protein [Nocardiopsis sp. DSM 44743]